MKDRRRNHLDFIPCGDQAGIVLRVNPPVHQLLIHRHPHRRVYPLRQRPAGAGIEVHRVSHGGALLPDLLDFCIHRDCHGSALLLALAFCFDSVQTAIVARTVRNRKTGNARITRQRQ